MFIDINGRNIFTTLWRQTLIKFRVGWKTRVGGVNEKKWLFILDFNIIQQKVYFVTVSAKTNKSLHVKPRFVGNLERINRKQGRELFTSTQIHCFLVWSCKSEQWKWGENGMTWSACNEHNLQIICKDSEAKNPET